MRDIAFYTILMTVVLHLLPEESQRKYVRFFLGIVLMLVVLSPRFVGGGSWPRSLDGAYAAQTCDAELAGLLCRRQEELEQAYEREIEQREQELTGDGMENPADGAGGAGWNPGRGSGSRTG